MEITAKDIYFVCPAKDLAKYMCDGDNQRTGALSENETAQDVYNVLSKLSGSKLASFFSNDSLMPSGSNAPKFNIKSMRVVNPVSEEAEILEVDANADLEEDCIFELNISYEEYPDYLSFLKEIKTDGRKPVEIGPADFALPESYLREIQRLKTILSNDPVIKDDPTVLPSLIGLLGFESEDISHDYFTVEYGLAEKTSELMTTYLRTYFGCVINFTAIDCALYNRKVTKEIVDFYVQDLRESFFESFWPGEGVMFFV